VPETAASSQTERWAMTARFTELPFVSDHTHVIVLWDLTFEIVFVVEAASLNSLPISLMRISSYVCLSVCLYLASFLPTYQYLYIARSVCIFVSLSPPPFVFFLLCCPLPFCLCAGLPLSRKYFKILWSTLHRSRTVSSFTEFNAEVCYYCAVVSLCSFSITRMPVIER
jgi:hypothetical protein